MARSGSYLVVLAFAGCTTFGGVPDTPDGGTPDASGSTEGGTDASVDVGTGCPNYALAFDGSQYLEVPDSTGLFDTPQPRTFEAWINVTRQNANNEQHIVSHHNHEQGGAGWLFMLLDVNPGVAFRAYGTSDTLTVGGGSKGSAVALDKWVHVAAVWEELVGKASVYIFVDGRRVAAQAGDFVSTAKDFNGVLRIGMAAYTKQYFGFIGMIDEIRISSKALYSSSGFEKPTARLEVTTDTIALWHFDEADGAVARDATGRHDAAFPAQAKERPTRANVPCFPGFGK